jgi:integrase/recombinase XerD
MKVTDKDSHKLMDAILTYTEWLKSTEDCKGVPSHLRHIPILTDFLIFIFNRGTAWDEIFTFETFDAFRAYRGNKGDFGALKALSHYLFTQGRIDRPLQSKKPTPPLPDIYEEYIFHRSQGLNNSPPRLNQIRRVLRSFNEYLEKNKIPFSNLKIEHCDAFMTTFKVAEYSRRLYGYCLKGFLKYLYHEKKIIPRDLAQLIVGPPQFAQKRLPKFLRPEQVKKLFASLKLSTSTQMRTYVLIHLAYSLGLRPSEMSWITLDDISFQQGELTLRERKGGDPITLPVPENTIKAIALYVSKGRPQGPSRYLFLNHQFPYRRMRANNIIGHIAEAMKQAGLPSSAYWLRHTYAQNLLHMGRSIYEVKEMMGHQNIQSTHRYLHISTELMRKVLFDEEL